MIYLRHEAVALDILHCDPSLEMSLGELIELANKVATRTPRTLEMVLEIGRATAYDGVPVRNIINVWRTIIGEPLAP